MYRNDTFFSRLRDREFNPSGIIVIPDYDFFPGVNDTGIFVGKKPLTRALQP
jgi:hypothetical protein